MDTLNFSYRFCENLTKRQAKNFAFAFIFLPKFKQRAMNAVYAFARVVDDIADEEGRTSEQRSRDLENCRHQLREALKGHPRGPVMAALAHTISSFEIPVQYFYELIDGMEMDLDKSRYSTFSELWKYCYHVASTVGLITIEIFGYRGDVREYAIDMGIALQLTNIIRDIQEDLERDRLYLPQEDLEKFSLREEDLKKEEAPQALSDFMGFQVQRAEKYYENAAKLMGHLSRDSVFCPATLKEIYHQILLKIKRENFDVFSRRIRLTTSEKLMIAFKMWLGSQFEW